MKKLYAYVKTKILEIMLTFMNPTVLTGVLVTSMVGGFNMFAAYICGVIVGIIFFYVYNRRNRDECKEKKN